MRLQSNLSTDVVFVFRKLRDPLLHGSQRRRNRPNLKSGLFVNLTDTACAGGLFRFDRAPQEAPSAMIIR